MPISTNEDLKPIVFIHTQKTAGHSIRIALESVGYRWKQVKYTNSFIDLFKKYDTIWTSSLLKDDFNYLRKFRKILFPRSTFSWWAAVTGVANEVYVYGPWAPHKSKTDGWLGETNYEGWKSWS